MPGFNGTGPSGQGARTGGGFGYCPPAAGASPVNYGSRAAYGVGRGGFPFGGGRGRAFGGGRGLRWSSNPINYNYSGYNASYPAAVPSAEDEVSYLKNVISGLEAEMTAVKKRMDEIKGKAE